MNSRHWPEAKLSAELKGLVKSGRGTRKAGGGLAGLTEKEVDAVAGEFVGLLGLTGRRLTQKSRIKLPIRLKIKKLGAKKP